MTKRQAIEWIHYAHGDQLDVEGNKELCKAVKALKGTVLNAYDQFSLIETIDTLNYLGIK